MNENTDELPDIGAAQGEMIETEAGREKTIRHGQISLLHRWWARRPNVLARIATYLAITEEQSPRLDFLAALGAVSPNASTLAEACSRVRDASWRWALRESQSRTKSDLFQVDAVSPLPPKVLDPFAGGGSIPMEANRLGCHAYAGDLSPVAYRILRATIEYPARLIAADDRSPVEGGDGKWAGLVPELRHWTGEVEQRAGRRLAGLFPPDPNTGDHVDRYFWFTFLRCPVPACGTTYPMQQSLGLTHRPDTTSVSFECVEGRPTATIVHGKVTAERRGIYTCPVCGSVRDPAPIVPQDLSPPRLSLVRRETKGGKTFATVLAEAEHSFLPWSTQHGARLQAFLDLPESQSLQAQLPALYGNLRTFGITTFADLFSPRQLLVTFEYIAAIREVISELHRAGLPLERIDAIATYLSFFVAYLVDRNSKLCSWNAHRGDTGTTFDQAAPVFPKVFVERSPRGLMEAWLASAGPSIETAASVPAAVTVYQGDASSLPFEANFFDAIVTDPPYYDAIPYADLGAFFWAWESMIPANSPPINHDATVSGEYLDTRRGDDPNIYRKQMLRAFKEVHRVLKPGRKFCLIFSGKVTDSFQEYVDLCQQASLELVDVKQVPEKIRAVAEAPKQITYLIYLRKPSSRPMREPLQAAEASSLLDAVAAGKPVLYSGLAELIAQELPDVDIAEILPAGGKGATIEQLIEVLADEDPRELIEKCFSKRELREIAKRLNAGTALDATINPIEFVLSQYSFWLPSASKKIDGATQVRQKLRGMQGRISQAIEKADIRGAFVEGCTAVERLLRVSIWGWAQLVFGSDRDAQLLRALQEEDANKRYDLNRLSAGHIITLFRRLPDAIATSPMAPMIERKFGRRHVYLASNKKTKYVDRLGEVFDYRNKVEHDKDGYWTTITLADAREELALVLARAGQLLPELVDARAIPRVAEPISETRDKWNRKSYLLSMDDGIDLEVRFSSPLTLGGSYLYYGSETNPRPVDPLVLPIMELGTIP